MTISMKMMNVILRLIEACQATTRSGSLKRTQSASALSLHMQKDVAIEEGQIRSGEN